MRLREKAWNCSLLIERHRIPKAVFFFEITFVVLYVIIHFIHLDLLYLQPNRSSLTKENADYPGKCLKKKVSEITIILPLQIIFYGLMENDIQFLNLSSFRLKIHVYHDRSFRQWLWYKNYSTMMVFSSTNEFNHISVGGSGQKFPWIITAAGSCLSSEN